MTLVCQGQTRTLRSPPEGVTDGRWIITFYEGLDSVGKLETLDIAVPLAEIYDGVTL